MVYPLGIVSLCLGKSIRMRRVVISVSDDLLLTLQTAQTYSRGARDSKIGKKWLESSRILDYILS